jgi:catechol 2,3-dioxygenase-like lactoylglutathione lyase family enzyme
MVLIRRVEERLRDDSADGKLPGAVHLYIGEEAVAAGVCAHLSARDYATSTHRGHGHFLAKGGDVRAMMAEIWAKREGICRGMGGSMHVADLARGILGANGIVGAGLSIATGAAFGAKLDGDGKVSVCFFGDGAANQGALMETALVHGEPVPFTLRVAFGALGGVLIELLEPLDDKSPHAEFLAANGEGLHHLAYLVPDFDDQLAAVRAARPEAKLLIDGTGPGNPVRWVYVDGGAARGTVIELLERTPLAEAHFGPALDLLAGPRR